MSFHSFYNTWTEQLRQLILQLRQAPPPEPTADEHHHNHLQPLVQNIMSHYDEYYQAKSSSAKNNDVLSLFSAPWASALEKSLHWIGGWRPTTAFHLIYTECSILFESHVVDILRGRLTGDLGDLSPVQLHRVSELQCETVQEENHITDDLSNWQCPLQLLHPGPELEILELLYRFEFRS